jgi:hypothetical protein
VVIVVVGFRWDGERGMDGGGGLSWVSRLEVLVRWGVKKCVLEEVSST